MVDKAKVTPSRSSARVAGSWQEISPRGTEQQLNGLRKQIVSPKCNTALPPSLQIIGEGERKDYEQGEGANAQIYLR